MVEVGNFGAKIRRILNPPRCCINMEIEQNAMPAGGTGAVGDSIVNEMKIKRADCGIVKTGLLSSRPLPLSREKDDPQGQVREPLMDEP